MYRRLAYWGVQLTLMFFSEPSLAEDNGVTTVPVSPPLSIDSDSESQVTLPVPGAADSKSEEGQAKLFFDARSTGFTRDGKQQVLDGDVIAIGSRSIVTADKVTVDQNKHLMIAEGHVVVLASDQILVGDKIEYYQDSGDFRITNAKMVVNDKTEAERIANDVLGFTPKELSFETDRHARINELDKEKNSLKFNVREYVKRGEDLRPSDVNAYSRYLEQEDLINGQENPAFAHMTEARRKTLKKRRDYWEKSKVSDRVQVDGSKFVYFRLEGDELTRTNGNDFTSKHSLWTPCRCEKDEVPPWGFRSTTTEAQMGGYATFYDVMVEIKGVPVIYLPWMKVPIKDRRQSGLLMPSITESSVSGSGYSQPLFLDLGRDKDATLKADIFEKRGIKGAGEFRWKHREYSGFQLNLEGMRDRLWIKQRANRRDINEMYTDGLAVARTKDDAAPDDDISGFTGREYARRRIGQRSWWKVNQYDECLSKNEQESKACLARIKAAVSEPTNANRGMARWRGYERLNHRTAFVTAGELFSDRRYNADLYVPDSLQPGFDSGTGERAINPIRSRLTYDGDDYFAGASSYVGDPSLLNDRFEGYQLPLVLQAKSRWHLLSKTGQPVYMRASTDHYRITRNPGSPDDQDNATRWLPGGQWRRLEASFLAPLTKKSAIQVDQFVDIEGRTMTFDGNKKSDGLNRESNLLSWKNGFRFQLPIDGKSVLPSWLGTSNEEEGTKMIQHVMNWSMTLATRPMVRRRGPYGAKDGVFSEPSSSNSTWFSSDRYGGDSNIAATDLMSEYQIVSFATNHRWKLYREVWKTTLGEANDRESATQTKLSYQERARRELLYTLDRPIRDFNDLFSEDQTKWFTNRYQLLDTDYQEPLTFSASINYDRWKDILRKKQGRTRENRPWSDASTDVGLSYFGWSLGVGSNYNIYDKIQSKLSSRLVPPSAFNTDISLTYTIDRAPRKTKDDQLTYTATSEKQVSIATTLLNPVTATWIYARKHVYNAETHVPDDYQQKLTLNYGSTTGCWAVGFARQKSYGQTNEKDASYLLQFSMTFMGQTRPLPNIMEKDSYATHELKKG